MLTPGTLLGERYEIIEKIGAGGMSIVYKAKDNRLQRFVAIKELREEFVKDEEFVAKFRKEALSAASLSHPNIVGIYDVGSAQDTHYIVMEYVEGRTLKEVIAEAGPFDTKTVLDLGIQMVSALKHAHSKKIIHRDIKPQNILLTHEGVLKVTDFGIAKAVDSSTIVATGNAIGSVHYFSPEQAKGKYVNESSDLYSCGIVLFELATKKLPFEADSHISIALKHINEELPKPSKFNPAIADNLEQLILKAASKGQMDRYQNADEMLRDMRGILQNPNYMVHRNVISQQTILLSPADTELLRGNGKTDNQSEKLEDSAHTSIYQEGTTYLDDQDDEEEVSTLYKVLVSIGGVFATLTLVVIVSLAAVFWIPGLFKSDLVVVPDLSDMTVEKATSALAERHLKIKINGEGLIDAEEGIVYEQNPVAGEKVKKNAVVEVMIIAASGDDTQEGDIELPDFSDMDAKEAIAQIRELGLESNELITEFDEVIKIGNVIRQLPEAHAKLQPGDKVTLIVSKGPEVKVEMTTVPNLIGRSTDDASALLNQNKLLLNPSRTEYSDKYAEGVIISQGVAAGTEIEEGSRIDVVVSKGQEKPEEPTPEPTTEPTASPSDGGDATTTISYSLNLPNGLEAKDSYHVVATLKLANGTSIAYDSTVVHDQFPVTISLTGSGSGKVAVSFDGVQQYEDSVQF